jgi:hypothetical protein
MKQRISYITFSVVLRNKVPEYSPKVELEKM